MRAASVLLSCLVLVACEAPVADDNQSPVIVRITAVTAEAGGDGEGGRLLLSDLLDANGTVFNDNAVLQIQVFPKNQQPSIFLNDMADVIIERFEVKYVRTDGRDVEGVDVPFAITGGVTVHVPVNGTNQVGIIVVRHQAKSEPPLANLATQGALFSGGAKIVTMYAQITLYGHTIAGKAVKSNEATLEISFGDFNGS